MPLVIVAIGVILLLLLMIRFKMNGFIALVLVALAVGLMQGMPDETLSRHPAAYSIPGNDKNSLETVVYSCVAINNTLFQRAAFNNALT